MAKFIYRMQSILDIKVKLETQAKMQFASAKHALDIEEEKLEILKDRRDVYFEEAWSLRNHSLNVKQLRDNNAAIQTLDNFIEDQKGQVRAAQDKLEAAREQLQEVMQERKIQEKLREKSFEDFLMEENHRESKEVDELTSYTYGQRRMENQ